MSCGSSTARKENMWQKGQRKQRLQQALELYEHGYSVKDMAKEMGVTLNTIYGYIAELGLKKKKYQDAQKNVIAMYAAGKKVSEISETLGVSASFIHKEIKNAGLKMRNEYVVSENNLINEKTVFADHSIKLEKVIINGRWMIKNGRKCRINKICTDVTPIFSQR